MLEVNFERSSPMLMRMSRMSFPTFDATPISKFVRKGCTLAAVTVAVRECV